MQMMTADLMNMGEPRTVEAVFVPMGTEQQINIKTEMREIRCVHPTGLMRLFGPHSYRGEEFYAATVYAEADDGTVAQIGDSGWQRKIIYATEFALREANNALAEEVLISQTG